MSLLPLTLSSHLSSLVPFFFFRSRPPPPSPLFPYTTLFRSLRLLAVVLGEGPVHRVDRLIVRAVDDFGFHAADLDRKSTRLNSSHVSISYAVFCLKKKTTTVATTRSPRRNTTRRSRRPHSTV